MPRTYKTAVGWTGETAAMPEPTASVKTTLAILVRDDLPVWQRLNITAFVTSGVVATHPQLVGEPYRDADGTSYLPMLGHPVLVFEADAATVAAAHGRALSRDLAMSVFTADLFATGNDVDNRAAVAAVPGADLDLVGLAVFGPRNAVDKSLKGARRHP
jgi:hypothetical protein